MCQGQRQGWGARSDPCGSVGMGGSAPGQSEAAGDITAGRPSSWAACRCCHALSSPPGPGRPRDLTAASPDPCLAPPLPSAHSAVRPVGCSLSLERLPLPPQPRGPRGHRHVWPSPPRSGLLARHCVLLREEAPCCRRCSHIPVSDTQSVPTERRPHRCSSWWLAPQRGPSLPLVSPSCGPRGGESRACSQAP